MAPSPQHIETLLALLHEGLFETPYWSSFLDKLREITGADYASMMLRRADPGFQDVRIRSSANHACRQDQYNGAEINKTLNSSYGFLETNRPYNIREIINLEGNRHLDYIHDLTGSPINYATGVRVVDPNDNNCWLTIGRTQTDFEPWTELLIAQIAPHLTIAVRTLAELERERMRADIASYAVLRLNFGWLTFDARGHIVDINPEAEQLFRNEPQLLNYIRDHTLPLRQPLQKKAFAETITSYAEKRSQQPRAIHLLNEPWLDMLMVPAQYRAVSGGRTPIAVGYVHGAGTVSADRRELLMQLFGLTDSEARLALAMSQGMSIGEAAAELNLTVETARTYTKRIYAKTDTRGNADLVRTILGSVIALT